MKRSLSFACIFLLLLSLAVGIVSASPKITSITPSSAPNDGVATITLTGTGFSTVTTATLNRCPARNNGGKGEPAFPGTIREQTSTQLVVDFSLGGRTPGLYYDVKVNAPFNGHDDWSPGGEVYLEVYQAGSRTPTPTATKTTVATTATTISTGDNSVYFETEPSGATIYVDGDEVGTSTFIYRTSMDGVHDVLVKKIGYQDYSDRVTIIDNSRVRFYAELIPLSSSSTPAVTITGTMGASGTPVKTATTIRKSTLKIPTPLGTFAPPVEEAPLNPALALWAAGIGAVFIVIRRR